MVGGQVDRTVTQSVPMHGDEIRAPDGKIVLLYDGFIVGEVDDGGREWKKLALFEFVGSDLRRVRDCSAAEVLQIAESRNSEQCYGRCKTEHVSRGSTVTFLTK